MEHPNHDELFDGNWSNAPKSCDGRAQIWGQTIGCSTCGMNIWHLPNYGQWPEWDKENEPPEDWWTNKEKYKDDNQYDPYFRVFDLIHVFQGDDAHDPGDEDPYTDHW